MQNMFDGVESQQEQILNIIRNEMSSKRVFAWGIVDAYDAKTHSVQVKIRPTLGVDEEITGFIPFGTFWAGEGWGAQFAPIPKTTHCLVFYLGNPVGAMFALGLFFNNVERPPNPVMESGEGELRHNTGTVIKMQKDGRIVINSASGSLIDMSADGRVSIQSKASTTIISEKGRARLEAKNGELQLHTNSLALIGKDSGEFKKLINEDLKAIFNNHTHPFLDNTVNGPSPNETFTPSKLILDSTMTKTTKAN